MDCNSQISVVMGSKNRKNLIKATIESIRDNGFDGKVEIIVVDGGSTDGTCDWLAKQKDIFTIVQPNYSIIDSDGIKKKAHSWGEFMNIGFKYAKSDYICMVSDDLILAKGCLQKGYDEMRGRIERGEKIGGGAFFFREYPRMNFYRTGILPGDYIIINHGFYYRPALEEIGWLDEINYNFYYADADVSMRLNEAGWKTIDLTACFASHLSHLPATKEKPAWLIKDTQTFENKYPYRRSANHHIASFDGNINVRSFWRYAIKNVIVGYLMKYYDKRVRKVW